MAAIGTIHEHTLTVLQRDLACEDRRARRFINLFDQEFHFEVCKCNGNIGRDWDTIFFIDVAEKVFGKDRTVKSLDELYTIWVENNHRKPDGWKEMVCEVFGKWGEVREVLTDEAIGIGRLDIVTFDPFPNRNRWGY